MADMKFIIKAAKRESMALQAEKLTRAGISFKLRVLENDDFELTVDSEATSWLTRLGNNCKASIYGGTVNLGAGIQVNLLEMQATLNGMFGETGDNRLAAMANQLSTITGLVQGPHEDWEEVE